MSADLPRSDTPEVPPPLHTVCGRRITTSPNYFYPTPYLGATIYFCTVFCLDTFNADPDLFYQAHSRNAVLLQVDE